MKLLIPIIFLLASCGDYFKKNIRPHEAKSSQLEKVESMRDKYCVLSGRLYAERNYIVNKCDGLLFASLHNLSCGWPSLSKYEKAPGQWFRSQEKDCFETGGANAQSSKDMLQGLILKLAYDADEKNAQEILRFAKDNDGFFCEAADLKTHVSKCLLVPQTYDLLNGIGSKSNADARLTSGQGFTLHLKALRQLQVAKIFGGISGSGLDTLKSLVKSQPENALFQAALARFTGGDMSKASELLLKHCPKDRLPTSHDVCTDYRYQRNKSVKDWAPCKDKPKEIHFGTDCAFAATVILGDFKSGH